MFGQLPGHVALPVLLKQTCRFDDAGQGIAQTVDPDQRAADVIEHVAEPDPG